MLRKAAMEREAVVMAREAGMVGRWGYFLGGDGGVTVVMMVTMGAIVGSGVGEAVIVGSL